MGQFDFDSAAALSRIRSEQLAASPAKKLLGIGSKLLDLVGLTGAASLADIIQELKNLAVDKDEANLIYFAEAFVADLRRLYELNDETRKLVDEAIRSRKIDPIIENATLHITRTNVQIRIGRVALVIANGIKSGDLDVETLDDMMRIAVDLSEWDIWVLSKMHQNQGRFASYGYSSHEWSEQIGVVWEDWPRTFQIGENQHLRLRSSLSRLQSAGLVAEVQTNFVKDGSLARQPFGLLPEGVKFFERIQKIGS